MAQGDGARTVLLVIVVVNATPVPVLTWHAFNSPPYKVDAKPNPLNKYGRSKAAGEVAIQEALPSSAVLRVPVLFGTPCCVVLFLHLPSFHILGLWCYI